MKTAAAQQQQQYSTTSTGNVNGLADSQPARRLNSAPIHRHRQQQVQERRHSNSGPLTRSAAQQQQTNSSNMGGALQTLQQQQPQQRGLIRSRPQSEDTLEYFIKFPTPNYRNEFDDTAMAAPLPPIDSDYVFVYDEPNVPVVVLLGWAGCQDRYLMKYSKIYEDRGLITIRYTAPVDTLFWKRSAMMPIGEKILKLICDMNFDAHPMIFHIFSNGGAYLYQHISLAMHKHNKAPLQIRGMIFDSAPGERRILGLYRAVTAIYGREKRKCNCVTALVITLTLSLMWFAEETFNVFKSLFVRSASGRRLPAQTNPFTDLKNEPAQFPQLFLYSKGDVVIPYEDVEKFIRIRQQQGVSVTSVCFEDAEHVKIYTKYPTQYLQCICMFVNNCLALPYKDPAATAAYSPQSAATSSLGAAGCGSTSSKYD